MNTNDYGVVTNTENMLGIPARVTAVHRERFEIVCGYGITAHEFVGLPAGECLMVRELVPGGLEGIHGKVAYHDYNSLHSG